MSLSAAHASTPCGAPAITSSVVSTPAARSRCAYATSSSWNTRRPRCTATRAAARRGPRGGRRLRSAARRRSRRLGPDRERHPTRLERLVQMRWASASRVRSRAVRSSSMGQNSHCAATPTPSCASGTGADRVPSRTLRHERELWFTRLPEEHARLEPWLVNSTSPRTCPQLRSLLFRMHSSQTLSDSSGLRGRCLEWRTSLWRDPWRFSAWRNQGKPSPCTNAA